MAELKTYLSNQLEVSGMKAHYDTNAKKILSDKEILFLLMTGKCKFMMSWRISDKSKGIRAWYPSTDYSNRSS